MWRSLAISTVVMAMHALFRWARWLSEKGPDRIAWRIHQWLNGHSCQERTRPPRCSWMSSPPTPSSRWCRGTSPARWTVCCGAPRHGRIEQFYAAASTASVAATSALPMLSWMPTWRTLRVAVQGRRHRVARSARRNLSAPAYYTDYLNHVKCPRTNLGHFSLLPQALQNQTDIRRRVAAPPSAPALTMIAFSGFAATRAFCAACVGPLQKAAFELFA